MQRKKLNINSFFITNKGFKNKIIKKIMPKKKISQKKLGMLKKN